MPQRQPSRPQKKSRNRTPKPASSTEDGRLLRGQDARLRMIAAAAKAFGTYGFEGTSLRTIAEEAGLAFQLITYHFGSKEDLWTAVLVHLFEQRLKPLRNRQLDVGGDLDGQVREWIRNALVLATEEPMLRRIFTQEYFGNSVRYHRILKPKIEEFMRASTAFHQQLAKTAFGKHFTAAEMQLIFRCVIAANCVMPHEIQMTVGAATGSQKSVEMQTELLFNLFKHGRGALQAGTDKSSRGARKRRS